MQLQPERCCGRHHLVRAGLGHGAIARNTLAAGSNSCRISSRFGATSTLVWVTPVTLPPGRLRLATRPSWTGSAAVSNTIGTVEVVAFAARAAGVLVAAMTATCRCT